MAFQLDYVAPAGADLVGLTVQFHADDWQDAESWARSFARQLRINLTGATLWCGGVTLTLT